MKREINKNILARMCIRLCRPKYWIDTGIALIVRICAKINHGSGILAARSKMQMGRAMYR